MSELDHIIDDEETFTVRAEDKKARDATAANNSLRSQTHISSQTGRVTVMKVKKGTPMNEVFRQYAEICNVPEDQLNFLADGKEVHPGTTPAPWQLLGADQWSQWQWPHQRW